MLEIRPVRILSCDYTALLDGAPLTTVVDTVGGPVSGRFELAGDTWRVGSRLPGRGVLGKLVMALRGRRQAVLQRAGEPLAIAERQGLRDRSYVVTVGQQRHRLAWIAGSKGWQWQGEGCTPTAVERISGTRCGLRIDFSPAIAPAVQVFVGLIAMSAYETVSRGD